MCNGRSPILPIRRGGGCGDGRQDAALVVGLCGFLRGGQIVAVVDRFFWPPTRSEIAAVGAKRLVDVICHITIGPTGRVGHDKLPLRSLPHARLSLGWYRGGDLWVPVVFVQVVPNA